MNLIGQATRKSVSKRRYRVLTFPTHERHQSLFSNVNADFYLCRLPFPNQYNIHVKDWDKRYAPLPPNHFLLSAQRGLNTPEWLDFDVILVQNVAGQLQLGYQLAKQYGVPVVRVEHTLPPPNAPPDYTKYLKENFSCDKTAFITKCNRDAWGFSEDGIVIGHALDTYLFCPGDKQRGNHILTVANDYINRDWCLGYSQYQRVAAHFPGKMLPVGDTSGLSKAAKDVAQLVEFYQMSRIFLNTAHVSPVPMSTLEALSCGCAVVSCYASAIPEYITHGENGFLAKNDAEMIEYLELLLHDATLAEKMGQAARTRIVEQCSLERFTAEWDSLLEGVVDYVGY